MSQGKSGKDEIRGEEKYQEKLEAAVYLKMNYPILLFVDSLLVKLHRGNRLVQSNCNICLD